jgi:hypothetical protein
MQKVLLSIVSWFLPAEMPTTSPRSSTIGTLRTGYSTSAPQIPYGVPSFVSKLESPLAMPSETLLFNVAAMPL